MDEKRPSLKDRLSRLEAELDDLLLLQENTKRRPSDYEEFACGKNHQLQRFRGISVTTRSRAMISNCNHRPCCSHDQASAPLSDISRFLQHINLNLSKGTQAITKLATSHQDTKKQTNNNHPNDGPHVWKSSAVEKTCNEDDLFKELREEKDKRARAENLVKCLKNELKNTKCGLQEKTESTVQMLREELRDTTEKLKHAESELQKHIDEYRSAEYLWPLKCEQLGKELRVEKQKNEEAQENIRQLQSTVQNLFMNTEECLTLQRTANWLKTQNENLLCLAKKLKEEIEMKNVEISKKKQCLEDDCRRIKQLTVLCGKLRDFLVVTKEKLETAENKLKLTMEHCQKLSERMLQTQRQTEDLQRRLEENKHDHTQISSLLRCSETKNNALHSRLEEISEMMKKQNELISRQSGTIETKEEQLKLAYENIKLQSQLLADFKRKSLDMQNHDNTKQNSILHTELSRVQSELESERENAMIKEKVIESQLKTISENKKDIMNRQSEIDRLRRALSETEQKLAIEKTSNEEFLSKNKQLQLRKEELKRRLEYLEEECLQSSEHTAKLEEIEKQVRIKQTEWEELKKVLLKEKDEALDSLKCAYQKLDTKTADYQLELQSKQRLIDCLKSQVEEKENKIQEATHAIVSYTKQLKEAEDRSENLKKRFEEGLQSACEVWQKTIQQLHI